MVRIIENASAVDNFGMFIDNVNSIEDLMRCEMWDSGFYEGLQCKDVRETEKHLRMLIELKKYSRQPKPKIVFPSELYPEIRCYKQIFDIPLYQELKENNFTVLYIPVNLNDALWSMEEDLELAISKRSGIANELAVYMDTHNMMSRLSLHILGLDESVVKAAKVLALRFHGLSLDTSRRRRLMNTPEIESVSIEDMPSIVRELVLHDKVGGLELAPLHPILDANETEKMKHALKLYDNLINEIRRQILL